MKLQDIQNDDGYLFLLKLTEAGFDHDSDLHEAFDLVKLTNSDYHWAKAIVALAEKIDCWSAVESFRDNSPQEWFDYTPDANGVIPGMQYAAQRRYGLFAIIISHLETNELIGNDVVSNVTT